MGTKISGVNLLIIVLLFMVAAQFVVRDEGMTGSKALLSILCKS